VRELEITLEIASPLIRISTFCKEKCDLVAFVDTDNPVSFVKDSIYSRYCKSSEFKVKPSLRNLRNLCDQPLDIKGTVKVTLTIDVLFETSYEVNLFVISNTILEADIILGREFLFEQKFTLVYKPSDQPSLPETNLSIVLHVLEDSENYLASVISDCDIDFDFDTKQKLKTVVLKTKSQCPKSTTDMPFKFD